MQSLPIGLCGSKGEVHQYIQEFLLSVSLVLARREGRLGHVLPMHSRRCMESKHFQLKLCNDTAKINSWSMGDKV